MAHQGVVHSRVAVGVVFWPTLTHHPGGIFR